MTHQYCGGSSLALWPMWISWINCRIFRHHSFLSCSSFWRWALLIRHLTCMTVQSLHEVLRLKSWVASAYFFDQRLQSHGKCCQCFVVCKWLGSIFGRLGLLVTLWRHALCYNFSDIHLIMTKLKLWQKDQPLCYKCPKHQKSRRNRIQFIWLMIYNEIHCTTDNSNDDGIVDASSDHLRVIEFLVFYLSCFPGQEGSEQKEKPVDNVQSCRELVDIIWCTFCTLSLKYSVFIFWWYL